MLDYPIIIHVPHSSTYIPKEFRNQFILSQSELANEIEVMTDTESQMLTAKKSDPIALFRMLEDMAEEELYSDQ